MRVSKQMAALVVAVGLLVSACADGSDGGEASAPSQQTAAPVADVSERIEAASTGLVERFGGQEAFAVVVVSVDQGYTVNQVLDHFSSMNAEGALGGVEPAGSPTNLVESEPASAAAPLHGAPGAQRVAFAQELDEASRRHVEFVEKTLEEIFLEATMSTLTQSADGELELHEGQLPHQRERAMVLGTLALLSRGYTLDQAITALILGTAVGIEDGESSCWFIMDEQPQGRDLMEEECVKVSDSHRVLADLRWDSGTTTSTMGGDVDNASGSGLDGVYTGLMASAWTEEGDVLVDELEMTIKDGTIVSLSGVFVVEFVSETGAGGRVLCVSEYMQGLSSTATAQLSDGAAEVPIDIFYSQSIGEPRTSEKCDEDLASEETLSISADVTVEDGVAVVLIRSGDQTGAEFVLQR